LSCAAYILVWLCVLEAAHQLRSTVQVKVTEPAKKVKAKSNKTAEQAKKAIKNPFVL
jgi:hypothetical protein